MTTKLDGQATTFLPFNQGDGGGAGNPVEPARSSHGLPVGAGLGARELARDPRAATSSPSATRRSRSCGLIFPRFHQLDATRKLQAAVLDDGPGGKYLVQHSAGSGKTNSIAWTAHFLAELHDAEHKKRLRPHCSSSPTATSSTRSCRTRSSTSSARPAWSPRSRARAAARAASWPRRFAGGKKIVVCTIQTFPFALEAVRELAATQGKRFAVIADEAHSSQTGEAAAKLKAVLTPEELEELGDGGEVSTEDILAAQMAARADDRGITFVAFTATPKGKTLELFGTRPDPTRKPAPDNVPAPFHVYSMRQAIEEEFILDVLQNYTPYTLAFKLAHEGQEMTEAEVERSRAMKHIMGWVKLHPYNIAQKVQIVVEHFREYVAPLLAGKAKAMVVVGSRVEAVRWQLAIEQLHHRARLQASARWSRSRAR